MLKTLHRIIQEVNVACDLPDILKIITCRIKEAMNADVCSIYLFNQSEQKFILMATEGLNKKAIGKIKLASGSGLVGLVGMREEPLVLAKASKHPNYIYFPESGEEHFDAFIGAPIIHHRSVMGVLIVQQKEQRQFNENEEAFLATICAQLSGVIAHAEVTGAIYGLSKLGKLKTDARFSGIAVAAGVGLGQAVVMRSPANLESVPLQKAVDIQAELSLLQTAIAQIKQDIKNLALKLKNRLQAQELALFDAYLLMLEDNALPAEINQLIKQGQWAQGALRIVIERHMQQFAQMDDPYLQERATDIRDLGRRILSHLQQQSSSEQVFPDNCILISEELSPSMLGQVSEDKLKGVVSMLGSLNSHVAILARAMGVPAVMCVADLPYNNLDQTELIIDGYRGDVIINPSSNLRGQYQAVIADDIKLKQNLYDLRNLPCETLDGKQMPLLVNVGLFADVLRAQEYGAEGVGLYRSEVPFMMSERFPSESEQMVIYAKQLRAVHPHPVTMRTLDIGGDKPLPYFPIVETNPFLGWRGIRITLDHPDIFLVQIRAMLKAAQDLDNLRILLPMIANLHEVEEAKRLIIQAFNEVNAEGFNSKMPPIGIMIEIPAAVYQIDLLSKMVDFIAVGSNDLTQYLLAVDRNNMRVARLYDFLHPAVLQALTQIVNGVHAAGKKVSICGEMAGDPTVAMLLMAMGFDYLSMNTANLPKVKWLLRQINFSKALELLEHIMTFDNAASIREFLQLELRSLGLERVLNPAAKINLAV